MVRVLSFVLLCWFCLAFVEGEGNHKRSNRVHVSFNGIELDGWLPGDCNYVIDQPVGCSAEFYVTNVSRSICTRTCSYLTEERVKLISELHSPIHIQVRMDDSKKSNSVTCKLKWNPFMYLVGYDIQIHYVWIDRIWNDQDSVQLISCDAHPLQSMVPVKAGGSFSASRRLVRDYHVPVWQEILSLCLLFFTILICSCCCAGCITFLCLAACRSSSRRRGDRVAKLRKKRRMDQQALKKKEEKLASKMKSYHPAAVLEQDPNNPQPLCIPYYMLSPYSVPMPLQQGLPVHPGDDRVEQIYHIPYQPLNQY